MLGDRCGLERNGDSTTTTLQLLSILELYELGIYGVDRLSGHDSECLHIMEVLQSNTHSLVAELRAECPLVVIMTHYRLSPNLAIVNIQWYIFTREMRY